MPVMIFIYFITSSVSGCLLRWDHYKHIHCEYFSMKYDKFCLLIEKLKPSNFRTLRFF
jgi:hypothetical protein